jgi:FPC/CPF motif-containing protein YcgG
MRSAANPFDDAVSIASSSCSVYERGQLIDRHTRERAPAINGFVHDALRALVLNEQFPCLGGKSAVRHGAYRFGLYGELGSSVASAGLARDLFTFVSDLETLQSPFSTYLASFTAPNPPDEIAFERLLWQTLQQLHDLDAAHHAWDPLVSADASDPEFSFSFGGVAFFVVGLHASSSRATRRFAWPTLVFNPHQQFEDLKATGRFTRFRDVIRRAERALQGDINPMLADYGQRSEASQYSGRQVDAEWKCPFRAHAARSEPLTEE